jgi:hypothetical protein
MSLESLRLLRLHASGTRFAKAFLGAEVVSENVAYSCKTMLTRLQSGGKPVVETSLRLTCEKS